MTNLGNMSHYKVCLSTIYFML